MANSVCVIEQLIQKPFQFKSINEKLDIVQSGRPCSDLPDLTAMHKDKSQGYIRHFQTSQYSKTQWIAGSSNLTNSFAGHVCCLQENKLFGPTMVMTI
jgi:hypothetical protein